MRRNLDSVLDLIDYGCFSDALAQLDATTSNPIEASILRLLIEAESDHLESASQKVRPFLERHLSSRERILCLFVLGRAAYMSNEVEELPLLRQTVALAEPLGDAKLLARAQTRLTWFVFHVIGTEAAMPELALLRRLAYAAADTYSLASFHCLVAEIEMKGRRYGAAAKHLRIADALCVDMPASRMVATINRLMAMAAVIASEPQKGLPFAHRAVEIFEKQGAKFGLVAALSALAELNLLVGNLDEAQSAATRALTLDMGLMTQLASLEALTSVALERHDVNGAAEMLAKIDALGSVKPDDYYWLWHVPSRARYLTLEGRGAEAYELLQAHKTAAFATADERLRSKFVLGEIDALIAQGSLPDAAARLADTAASLPIIGLEDLAQLNALASKLPTAHSQDDQRRARRIAEIAFSGNPPSYPFVLQPGDAPAKASTLHEAAALLAVGLHSELLAHELAALLLATGCADQVSVATDGVGKPPMHSGSDVVPLITLDPEADRHFVVFGRPKRDVESQTTLMSVRLIARAALDLGNLRRRERLEPSVWPETLSDEAFGMIVAAASMKELIEITRRVAASSATVLITGESGTGKELLARAVHEASQRNLKPFIPFNCTSVSRDMIDSQLFGHRRGAFTGAHEHFPGVIRAAASGTLFLDEVGELPLEVQPKLLRFLESGEIHPVGEARPLIVDVRIVAATNANLEQMVADGRFREDLYYRLNVVRLQVPPLRERREEIPLLVQHFVDKYSRESQKTAVRVAEDTMEYLVLYNWPGNVRQLANEIRRMVAFAETGAILMPEHLSDEIASSRRTIPAQDRRAAPMEFVVRMDQPLSAAVKHLERSMVQYALATAGDRLEDAARMLGLSRKGLYLKRQRLNLGGTDEEYDKDEGEESPANAG